MTNRTLARIAVLPLASLLVVGTATLALTGCKEKNSMEKAGAKMDKAVNDAAEATKDAAEKAGEKVEEAGKAIQDAAKGN